jgi:hypothetical protein
LTLSYDFLPVVRIGENEYEVEKLDDIKKYKAKGKRIEKDANVSIEFLEPLEYVVEQEEEQIEQEIEQINSELNDKDTMQGSLF